MIHQDRNRMMIIFILMFSLLKYYDNEQEFLILRLVSNLNKNHFFWIKDDRILLRLIYSITSVINWNNFVAIINSNASFFTLIRLLKSKWININAFVNFLINCRNVYFAIFLKINDSFCFSYLLSLNSFVRTRVIII